MGGNGNIILQARQVIEPQEQERWQAAIIRIKPQQEPLRLRNRTIMYQPELTPIQTDPPQQIVPRLIVQLEECLIHPEEDPLEAAVVVAEAVVIDKVLCLNLVEK